MSCGTEDCGCGCQEFVQLSPKKSLRVIQEAKDCGDGICGCGCGDGLIRAGSAQEAKEKAPSDGPGK